MSHLYSRIPLRQIPGTVLLSLTRNRILQTYSNSQSFSTVTKNTPTQLRGPKISCTTLRTYTQMGHKYDADGAKPVPWYYNLFRYSVILGFVSCMLNWDYLVERYPALFMIKPLVNAAPGVAEGQEFMDGLIYDYGRENIPESLMMNYRPSEAAKKAALIKTVEAAELPSIRNGKKGDAGDALPEGAEPHGSKHGRDTDDRKGGFRDRKITEYENRIRAYSTPDKVFRLFATLKIHDENGDGYGIYMTPDDFVRAITPGMRQPEGLGLDHFRTFDPKKDKMEETTVSKDSIFYKLGENGLINFSDYLFLMTVLAISARHIEIAFKIFDLNGDGTVDAEEFEEILTVLRQQTSVGLRHREAKIMGSSYQGPGGVNSGLRTFFFGKNGKGKLRVQDFLAFQARMKDEVLQREFLRLEPEDGKISEKAFAKMLLTYAGISEQKQKRMVKRVKERFQGDASKGVNFGQVQSFSQVFRHLNDIDTALGLYHVAGGSIDQATLQRVVRTVAKAELDDHIVDVVFTLFDDNEDGRLSQREFISIMKARQMRGLERPKDMGVSRLMSAIWKCTKEEVQGNRGA